MMSQHNPKMVWCCTSAVHFLSTNGAWLCTDCEEAWISMATSASWIPYWATCLTSLSLSTMDNLPKRWSLTLPAIYLRRIDLRRACWSSTWLMKFLLSKILLLFKKGSAWASSPKWNLLQGQGNLVGMHLSSGLAHFWFPATHMTTAISGGSLHLMIPILRDRCFCWVQSGLISLGFPM